MILFLQLICAAVLLISTLLYRFEFIAFKPFAGIFALMLLLALILGILAIGQSILLWRQAGGISASVGFALVLGLITGIALITLFVKASAYPLIHQISTDIDNPPVFTHAQSLRRDTDNRLDYGNDVITIQQAAYPHIQSLHVNLLPTELFSLAMDTAKGMGWSIEYTNESENRFEASVRSTIFGFTDDIVVRIEAAEQGSKIDLRSVSRVGRGDFGANAKRISDFLSRLQKQAAQF